LRKTVLGRGAQGQEAGEDQLVIILFRLLGLWCLFTHEQWPGRDCEEKVHHSLIPWNKKSSTLSRAHPPYRFGVKREETRFIESDWKEAIYSKGGGHRTNLKKQGGGVRKGCTLKGVKRRWQANGECSDKPLSYSH
jgi:hypothetical protein